MEDDNAQESSEKTPSLERLQAYLDQVTLRIYNASPGLACYLESSRVVASTGFVELSFYKIPEEIFAGVKQAFAIADVDVMRYTKNGKPCVGFRGKPTAEDLSALAVDDSDEAAKELQQDTDEVEGEANDLLDEPQDAD